MTSGHWYNRGAIQNTLSLTKKHWHQVPRSSDDNQLCSSIKLPTSYTRTMSPYKYNIRYFKDLQTELCVTYMLMLMYITWNTREGDISGDSMIYCCGELILQHLLVLGEC